MIRFDIAIWLRSSSPEPDLIEVWEADPSYSPLDVVQALMQLRKEAYIFKASVGTPYGIERLYRLALPLPEPASQISALEIVSLLWPLLETEGVDPVEVRSSE